MSRLARGLEGDRQLQRAAQQQGAVRVDAELEIEVCAAVEVLAKFSARNRR